MSQLWTPNPLTIIHDCIWQAIDECRGLDGIKKGNRVKYNVCKNNVDHSNRQSGDFPYITVMPDGFDGKLVSSTTGAEISPRYLILIVTDSEGYNCDLAQYLWPVFQTLCKLKESLSKVKWRDQCIAKGLSLTNTTEGLADRNLLKGHVGWTAMARISMKLCLPRKEICKDLTGIELIEFPNFEGTGPWDSITCLTVGQGLLNFEDLCKLQYEDLYEVGKLYRTCVYVRSGTFSINGNPNVTGPGYYCFEETATDVELSIEAKSPGQLGHVSVMEIQ